MSIDAQPIASAPRDQPYGRVLLTLTALGIASFGIYCFVWSRNAKH